MQSSSDAEAANAPYQGADPPMPSARLQWLVGSIAFAAGMLFALYTRNAWEDWYITYRASKNLALGNGLVFNPGQRIHSFTSPDGTLLPALLSFVTGNRNDDLVLWLFRAVSCSVLGATAVLMLRLAYAQRFSRFAIFAMIGLFAVDPKVLGFSISGMETAYLVFFVTLSLYALTTPHPNRVLMLGGAWGGLMWTRPDGFIYAAATALGCLAFNQATWNRMERPALLNLYLRAAAIAIVIYLPWVLWAWWYYGTPVPHTIIAKGLHQFTDYRGRLLYFPKVYFHDDTFTPAYYAFGGWSKLLHVYGPVAFACSWYWLLPHARSFGRAASMAFLVGHLYLNYIIPHAFPWYFPAAIVLGFIVIACIVEDVTRWLSARSAPAALKAVLPMLLVVGHLSLCAAVAYQLRNQESIIEQGHRKQIGLWLRDHAATPHDTVMMECLGYIGFYSNLKTYDAPGMSSPEMVAARRTLNTEEWNQLIRYLQPDWVVMRPREEAEVRGKDALLLTTLYQPVRVFDVTAQVAAVPALPGRAYLEFDEKFTVFHRIASFDPNLTPGAHRP